jgi:hypothetical protein
MLNIVLLHFVVLVIMHISLIHPIVNTIHYVHFCFIIITLFFSLLYIFFFLFLFDLDNNNFLLYNEVIIDYFHNIIV